MKGVPLFQPSGQALKRLSVVENVTPEPTSPPASGSLNDVGCPVRGGPDGAEEADRGNLWFRGAWVLTSSSMASYGLSFARNLILARMLTKADFGLAALFSNTLAMLEVALSMSFGQQIVQAPEGASRSFRDSAHAFQLVMAVAGAGLILGFSVIVGHFSAHQDVGWAVASLALVPLSRGFANLEVSREQRQFNQLPAVLCEFVPQLAATLAVWPLALWFGDFRVVLWLIIGKSTLALLMSHFVAKERYRLAWEPAHIRSMAKFGWPLVLNGVLMFASQQADQFLVAGFLSREQLASYSLAFSLASIPWALLAQPSMSLMLPVLSRVQDQPERFREHYRACVELAAVGAVLCTLPLIVFGEQFVTLFYGPKYAGTGPLVAMLGAATAVRFLRLSPAVASMAHADTRNQLISNVVRSMSLPLAALAVVAGWGALAVAAATLLAEICAGVFSALRLVRRRGLALGDSLGGVVYIGAFLGLAAILGSLGAPTWNVWLAATTVLTMLALAVSSAWFAFPETVRPLGRQGVGRLRRYWRPKPRTHYPSLEAR